MPDFKREIRARLEALNLEPSREAGIVEEMSQHLEQRFEEMMARGVSPAAAREAVMKELNDGRLTNELLQIEKPMAFEPALPAGPGFSSMLARLARDLRHAGRGLRLSPGFSAVAILSLALGIGANTAIFQLLDALRLRSLPVKNPAELVQVRVANQEGRRGRSHGSFATFSNAIWEQIRAQQQGFSGLAAWNMDVFNLATGGLTRNARAMFVNGDFFNTLGVPAIRGRVFTAADDQRGCGLPGAVISYGFWQKEFGGNASALGSRLTLEGQPVEIIGITGPSFYGVEVGRTFDVAVPICSEPLIRGESSLLDLRDGYWLAAIGRLKPDWKPAKATSQLESISPAVFRETVPPTYQPEQAKLFQSWKLEAVPAGTGLSRLRGDYEMPLWILLAIAATVLLIACANLANLMFARANAREREIAVRLALGASRTRLMQQLMAESLLLSFTGALAGVLLAQLLTRVLVSFLTTQFDGVSLDLALDWRVLAFTTAIAMLTCLFFGLMPAVKAAATPPIVAMKAGARGVTGGRERLGVRRVLVVAQVSMSMVLLVAAVLFVRSFQNLVRVSPGFREGGIIFADMDFTRLKIPQEQRNDFKMQLVERLRALPGVQSAATVDIPPISGFGWNNDVQFDDSGQAVREVSYFNRVGPGFFKTMDTAFIKGRDFGPEDTRTSPAVAVVNESFVRKVLHGGEPLGKIFKVDEGAGKPASVYVIVGLVKDTKYQDLRTDFWPIAYLARTQDKRSDSDASVVLRSDLALDSLTSTVENAVKEVSPTLTIQFSVFKDQIRDSLQLERLMASLSGFFGILAGVLATIGLYGVISYMVVRRRNEIGIRMALGADRGRVLRLVVREAATLLLIGVVAGSAISLAATRAAASLLYGLKPYDPFTLAMAAASLSLVAAAATYLPALRATQIHPTEALRED